jgi:hypothetical protein
LLRFKKRASRLLPAHGRVNSTFVTLDIINLFLDYITSSGSTLGQYF